MYSIRTRALCLVLAVLLLIPLFALPGAAAGAESPDNYDGSQLWLNYRTISDSALLKEYQAGITSIVVENADQNPTYRHMRNGTVFTPQRPSGAKETIPVSSLEAAKLELLRAAEGLLGKKVPESDKVSADGAVVVGTPASSPLVKSLGLDEVLKELGDEGYLIRSVTLDGHKATVVAANTEIGALYGTYAFIRLVQTKKPVQELDIADKPKVNHRRLNNWDTERLYAGTNQTGEGSSTGGDGSIFCFSSNSNANRLPVILDRYIIFARMCASVGINEITINNVNANYSYLSEEYILMEAALADALRPYGVKIGLSVRYVSPTNSACNTAADTAAGGPSAISGADANNPKADIFRNWWTKKTEQIRSRIPDFIGYTVKANSEGQPGPQDYGYDHGDGAYGMGQALKNVNDGLENHMTLFWRTFVYNASVDADRLKRAYMEFKPINDDESREFGENVFVQTKNGPLDFQGREPVHPMFGAMDLTNQAIELQITQEYTGHHVSLCYLGTEWEEIFKTDTLTDGKHITVGQVIDGTAQGQKDTAIVGVNNLGNTPTLTGHHFAQSNFFAFGRQAWDWTQSARDIAEDWVRMTWTNDEDAVQLIVKMMMGSYEALVSYQTPFGVGHQMTGTGTHYFPNPAQIIYNGGSIRDDWSPAYYSRVDGVGIGYNRTSHTEQTSFGQKEGSNLAGQYAQALAAQYDTLETTPENLLLWFHHVGWEQKLSSGRTFWEEAIYRTQMGVQYVSWMREAWESLAGKIDQGRHKAVAERLWRQEIDASEWRDYYYSYWQANSGLDKPTDGAPLSIAVTLGSGENAKDYQGFDLAVDSFNKKAPGNLPNSDSRYQRYIAAGGNIADASGAPFSNLFVPVDTAYTLAVPKGVERKITAVRFLTQGEEGTYEIVSNTESQAVVKVQREDFFGPLVKTYTFNFVDDAKLAAVKINGEPMEGFDPDKTDYALQIQGDVKTVPMLVAQAEDPAAEVTVKAAEAIPGVSTVTVKNGSETKTYTFRLSRAAAFAEDFDKTLSDEWTWVRENASRHSQSSSALTINGEAGDLKGTTNTAKNILLHPVGSGDWEATAKLTLSTIPSSSGQQAALILYQDDSNYIKVNVEYQSSSGGWMSESYLRASGGVEKNGNYTDRFYDALETRQNINNANKTIFFRIVKQGSEFRFFWGTDESAAMKHLGTCTANLTDAKLGTLVTGNNLKVSYDKISLEDRYDALVTTEATADPATCKHEYEDTVTPPTCTEAGYTTHVCPLCKDSFIDTPTEALGHDWGEGQVTTAPTLEQEGVRTFTCSRCGETKTEAIPALDAKALQDAIAKAEALSSEDYTEESWKPMAQALEEAKKALTEASDQKALNEAAKALEDALANLVEKPEPTPDPFRFDDVKDETAYFFKPVYWAKDNGITAGTTETTFGPNEGCTRAQVVTFLWRTAKQPEPKSDNNPFKDVKQGDYFYKAVLWAVEQGITVGTEKDAFSPGATCTRAQIVTFLYRFQGRPEAAGGKSQFTDVPDDAYYLKPVAWAVENGVTQGVGDGKFAPNDTCTRAQVVTFLYRAAQQ